MLKIEIDHDKTSIDMQGSTKELTGDAGMAVMAALNTLLSLGMNRAQALIVLTLAVKEVYK